MSLKRSRKQMSKVATANTKKIQKKMVRFNDAATSIPSSTAVVAEAPLWYTSSELALQLEDSRASTVGSIYGLLVANSYLAPHVYVQEYLNAFCAGTDSMGLRGLEPHLAVDLKSSKSQTRRMHATTVLAAQKQGGDLYVASRSTSASSKLFAMRMGRADARWDVQPSVALELVEELDAKEKGRRESCRRAISISTADSSEAECTVVVHSMVELQQVALPMCSSSLQQALALPEIVFGKIVQSTAA